MSQDRPPGYDPRLDPRARPHRQDEVPVADPSTGQVAVAPGYAAGQLPVAQAYATGQLPVAGTAGAGQPAPGAGPAVLAAPAPQADVAAAAPSPALHATTTVEASQATASATATAVALRAAPDEPPAADAPRSRLSATPPAGPPGAEALDPTPRPTSRSWATSRSGLARLRVGGHVCSRQALDDLGFAGTARGMRIGLDRDGQPVTVRPFRREPTRIALVGGYWAAQLVVFRTLALGARVVVATRTPQPWEAFGEWAVADRTRLRVVEANRPFEVDADPHHPTLIIDDAGALGGALRPAAWQTLLTVLPQLTGAGMDDVADADLVALQRLDPDEAAIASTALRLTSNTVDLLQMLEPDMLALLGGGADRYVWVSTTRIELDRFGPPQR